MTGPLTTVCRADLSERQIAASIDWPTHHKVGPRVTCTPAGTPDTDPGHSQHDYSPGDMSVLFEAILYKC